MRLRLRVDGSRRRFPFGVALVVAFVLAPAAVAGVVVLCPFFWRAWCAAAVFAVVGVVVVAAAAVVADFAVVDVVHYKLP